jgi:glucose/arabinose dehydrogenase
MHKHQLAASLIIVLIMVVSWPLVFCRTNFSSAQVSVVWPTISLNLVAGGFSNPVYVTNAGDGSGRLFVVEQAGRIKIIHNNAITGTFLDITDRVLSPPSGGSEQGLLGMAFPPGYGSGKDYFYVYYTKKDGSNQVSRFHLGGNPNTANPNSEEPIILLNHPTYTNHNGGQLAFGPDGYLYIGTGDGGGAGDPFNNAQNPSSLLGKILRIDVEAGYLPPMMSPFRLYFPIAMNSPGSTNLAYTIPPDNPYANTPGYRPEIWALGMRNPWRFSFDQQTHDLWIGDVGQNTWEEVDFQPSSSRGGENYGWNMYEGTSCYKSPCNPSGKTMPIYTYGHTNGNCSITGGFVYRGTTYPGMQGIYFFADYCSGTIYQMQRDNNNNWVINPQATSTTYNISSFGEEQSGELYLADRTGGSIYHIVETAVSH